MKTPPSLSLSVPSFLQFGGSRAKPETTVAAASFPPPPVSTAPTLKSTPRKTMSQVKAWKASGVQAPFKRADPSAPLTCRNETGDGGRVKVVCQ